LAKVLKAEKQGWHNVCEKELQGDGGGEPKDKWEKELPLERKTLGKTFVAKKNSHFNGGI